MNPRTAKTVFIWGTAASALLFLALTADTLRRIPGRTGEASLTAQVAQGKAEWQRRNCNDCHTILGIGGYYAPDLTKTGSTRDAAWLDRFLADPQAVWPAARRMPSLGLSREARASLAAFLAWTSGIDTNGWPPAPLTAGTAQAATLPGEAVFSAQGCSGCHTVKGVGGKVGPDLTQVGTRRDRIWLEAQINDARTHNPGSIMPSFASLPPKDKADLLDYLLSLK